QQKQAKEPAPNVNGRTAYWVTSPANPTYDSGQRILRWQISPTRWAQLLSNRPQGTDLPDDVLLQVAAQAQVEVRPVALPFWVSGLPEGLRPTEAEMIQPAVGTPWAISLGFTADDMGVGFTVAPKGGAFQYGKSEKSCRDEGDFQICATAESDSLPLAERFGGLEALTRMVHTTGLDQRQWTTEVIR
ncbi:hypothetical protein, partial [Streptomyces sp. FH025]|uniref:hypothetical protein n=1 Tax=Streptomyces sp. FH025 TaxID=2815937 RepID=UPI001A9D967B